MGRKQKYQAVVLSLRIPSDKKRDYAELMLKIRDLRRSVQVYAGVGMALTAFNRDLGYGTISKFSIIEVDGEWFDEDGFGPALEEDLSKISIPENLRPNLVSKPIYLSSENHLLVAMTYSQGKNISPGHIERYLKKIVKLPEIHEEFGAVQVDIFKDASEIETLLDMDTLKEVKITISRPNHLYDALSKEIEEALRDENADELDRTIKSKDDGYLEPGPTTRALGLLAAENGRVSVKYEKADGAIVKSNSEPKPLLETILTEDSEATEAGVFAKLKDKLVTAVQKNRLKADQVAKG